MSAGHDHGHTPARFDRALDRFEIEHVTLQVVRSPFTRPCADLSELAAGAHGEAPSPRAGA